MKTLLKVYVGAFALLFLVGALSGYGEREDVLKGEVLQNIVIHSAQETYYLTHKCEGKRTHLYDVERDVLHTNPQDSRGPGLLTTVARLKSHKDFIISAAGGSSGAFTISSLTKTKSSSGAFTISSLTKTKNRNRVAALVLGVISGYLVGHWTTALSEIVCTSATTKDWLENEASWKEIEQDYLTVRLYELGLRDSKWLAIEEATADGEDTDDDLFRENALFTLDPLNRCRTPIAMQVRSLKQRLDRGANPSSEDVRVIHRYGKVTTWVRDNRIYSELRQCIFELANYPHRSRNQQSACGQFDLNKYINSSELFYDLDKTYEFERSVEFAHACNSLSAFVDGIP